MKLYTLVCNYWNAGDWYNYTVNNRSMNPSGCEILGVFPSLELAQEAMKGIPEDEDFTQDMTIYESEPFNLDKFMKDYDLTVYDIQLFYYENWRVYFDGDFMKHHPVDVLTIEQNSKELQGDEIIIEWSYYRYAGYARKFHDIYTAEELGFEKETDLATGNEESTYRKNFSILLTHEEVEGLTEKELEGKIMEALEDGSWKWTYDSDYKWFVNMKFGTYEV